MAGLCLFGPWLFASPHPPDETGWYWVTFRDKACTTYSIDRPKAFLSEASLARRKRFGISVDSSDLPVPASYLDSLRAMGGKVQHTSRWFNSATVLLPSGSIAAVLQASFVDTLRLVAPLEKDKKKARTRRVKARSLPRAKKDVLGYSGAAMRMLRGDTLFQLGFRGEGMRIAVFDAGFSYLYDHPAFDSLLARGQLLATRDFIRGQDRVDFSSTHGSQVLALLAADIPGRLLGSAPRAGYALMRTENTTSEFPLEECHWIAAIEWADSLGIDLVNASLSYQGFSRRSLNYPRDAFDGRTALSSRASTYARSKGMLVVVSAGNNGLIWHERVGAPADCPDALTVGAVDLQGEVAGFSSSGPTSDGRIKPDLVAPGKNVYVPAFPGRAIHTLSGTSFAAPLLAGLVACLWQAFPEVPPEEIVKALTSTASLAKTPERKAGYGIPDFAAAYRFLERQGKGPDTTPK